MLRFTLCSFALAALAATSACALDTPAAQTSDEARLQAMEHVFETDRAQLGPTVDVRDFDLSACAPEVRQTIESAPTSSSAEPDLAKGCWGNAHDCGGCAWTSPSDGFHYCTWCGEAFDCY